MQQGAARLSPALSAVTSPPRRLMSRHPHPSPLCPLVPTSCFGMAASPPRCQMLRPHGLRVGTRARVHAPPPQRAGGPRRVPKPAHQEDAQRKHCKCRGDSRALVDLNGGVGGGQVKSRVYLRETWSRRQVGGHEASPQCGLGVGCMRFSSTKKPRGHQYPHTHIPDLELELMGNGIPDGTWASAAG